jgi:hypothetical protein
MRRFNWSCNQCGMSAGRRYSVERHIKTLHAGLGAAIPFEEYVIGRRNCIFIPKQMPRTSPTQKHLHSIAEAIDEELAKKAVQIAISEMGQDRSDTESIKKLARLAIMRRTNDFVHESINELRDAR